MKEKLLALLKSKFEGVKDATLDRIATKKAGTITDEAQIQSIVDGVTVDTIIESESDYRAEQVSKTSVNKAISDYETKHKLKDGKPVVKIDPVVDPVVDPGDIKTIVANAIKSAVEPLQQKLEGYEKAEMSKINRQKLVDKLKEEGITDKEITAFNLLAAVSVEKEDEIDSIATGIKEQFAAQKQILVDNGNYAEKPGSGSADPSKMKPEDYQKIMDGEEKKEEIGKVDLGLSNSE